MNVEDFSPSHKWSLQLKQRLKTVDHTLILLAMSVDYHFFQVNGYEDQNGVFKLLKN
jgi:hypothetical protein